MREGITFVTVVADFAELEHNLLASPVCEDSGHEWLLIDNVANRLADSITPLYCEALERATYDLVFFFHQDVYLPNTWEDAMFAALSNLEASDPNWGVIGAVGVVGFNEPEPSFRGHWGDFHPPTLKKNLGVLPSPVIALDELWLGIRKSSGLTFDRALPGWHCYGVDICMTAAHHGRRSYAIDAFLWHKFKDRSGNRLLDPRMSEKVEFRRTPEWQAEAARSKEYVGLKWAARLPFRSTSMVWM